MKRYRGRKRFKGMVHYGQARLLMFGGWARDLSYMERCGHTTALEAMESRASMQRRFRRRSP